jgi:hypothetical protein
MRRVSLTERELHKSLNKLIMPQLHLPSPIKNSTPQSSTRVVYWGGSIVAAGSAGAQAVRGVGSVELIGYEAKPDV